MQLPDQRLGLLMVFRPFERVSYALLLQVTEGVSIGDVVTTCARWRENPGVLAFAMLCPVTFIWYCCARSARRAISRTCDMPDILRLLQ